jgi:hypothetical protein
MTLQGFKDVLLTVTDKVYHLESWQESDEYIVWQELQPKSLRGDNGRLEVIHRAQIDLFTKNEFPEILDKLLVALDANDIAFEDPIPDYDSDEKQMRYIIQCEVA